MGYRSLARKKSNLRKAGGIAGLNFGPAYPVYLGILFE